ncbi:hypothetical protein [Bacillus sp. FJAT-27245]|uniref:hypothetical protein n=1 Tax=Bacillus sp. FJAT-27245 TaxID=1684144 RepID=UPI0006A761C3|nr:hypothetical protein [Bacillus sp. FJAT-27245]
MSRYVCPVCKVENEDCRNYCKECGTWLLSNTSPSKRNNSNPVKGSEPDFHYPQRPKISGWLIVLFTIGTGLFLFLLTISGLNYLYSFLVLYGLVGLALTIVLALIFALAGRFAYEKRNLVVLLMVSVMSLSGGIALAPEKLLTQGSVIASNGQAEINQSE